MNSQKGNALFLILIAVALFAALSYAITASGRGGSGIDKEQAEIQAAEILNYIAAVENEANRLRILSGINPYSINFANNNSHTSLFSGSGTGIVGSDHQNNPNCTVLAECSVFQDRGGNLPSRAFYDAAGHAIPDSNGHIVPGEFRVFNNFIEDVGSNTEPEILLTLVGISKAVCDALNRKLGLPLADTQPKAHNTTVGVREYWIKAANYASRLPSLATAYTGEPSFCVNNQHGYYNYIFYHAFHIE